MNKQESAPNHAIGEEERFETDFYNYLDSPGNSSRYTIAVDALRRLRPGKTLNVVDLGCGHANIAHYISDRINYVGVRSL